MQIGKRYRRATLFVGVLVATGVLAYWLTSALHKPTLLEISTFVTKRDIVLGGDFLSPHRIQVYRRCSTGPGWEPVAHDLDTGKETLETPNEMAKELTGKLNQQMDHERDDEEYGADIMGYCWDPTLVPPMKFRMALQHIPQHCVYLETRRSPDGKRRAWMFVISRQLPLQSLVKRLFPRIKTQPHLVLALCVSDANGQGMREIASTPFVLKSGKPALSGEGWSITDLQLWGPFHWFPDGYLSRIPGQDLRCPALKKRREVYAVFFRACPQAQYLLE